METKRINVTTAAYDDEDQFPEAKFYPAFVAEQLAARYGAAIDCTGGGLQTKVFVYGFGEDEESIRDEVKGLVMVGLWEEFCDHGYEAYSGPEVTGKVIVGSREVDADAARALMDVGIREELHGRQDWASEQDFVNAYCQEHRARFGEDFTVN